MWRLGDELAVRVQRMDADAGLQRKDRRWLPLLGHPAGGVPEGPAPYAGADEATVRRARGLAVLKSLFLLLMGQNGDRGLPGGKPGWGPVGRAALERVLSGR